MEATPPKPGPSEMQLIDYNTTPCDRSNIYGETLSGHFVVQGLTVPLIHSKQVVHPRVPDNSVGLGFFDEMDVESESGDTKSTLLMLALADQGNYLLSRLSDHGAHGEIEIDFDCFSSRQYLALIGYAHEDIKEPYLGIGVAEGLVLQQLNNGSEKVYERVEYFRLDRQILARERTWTRRTLTLV